MRTKRRPHRAALLAFVSLVVGAATVLGQDGFDALVQRLQREKPQFAERQEKLLEERYELANRPAAGVAMSRGKAVQAGVRVRLPRNTTWEQLAAMTPDDIKNRNLWPAGFYPCCAPTA